MINLLLSIRGENARRLLKYKIHYWPNVYKQFSVGLAWILGYIAYYGIS